MRRLVPLLAALSLAPTLGAPSFAQEVPAFPRFAQPDTAFDPIREMVGRLDLERYKATIKGLTQFGDRRQGTDRNRAAIDWIEAQLKSYGCTNTERIKYIYDPPQRGGGGGGGRGAGAGAAGAGGAGGGGGGGAARGGGGGGRGTDTTAGRGRAGAGGGAAGAAAILRRRGGACCAATAVPPA
jgi:hypothetical protein